MLIVPTSKKVRQIRQYPKDINLDDTFRYQKYDETRSNYLEQFPAAGARDPPCVISAYLSYENDSRPIFPLLQTYPSNTNPFRPRKRINRDTVYSLENKIASSMEMAFVMSIMEWEDSAIRGGGSG